MITGILLLLCGIALILFASIVFCNAIEHLGEKLGLSEGVTGSIFVAIGTALPETIVPIVAVLGATNATEGDNIGIGAILGAPLMLSTLSLCLVGFFGAFKRGAKDHVNAEPTGLTRDLNYFIFGYSLALILGVVNNFYQMHWLHIVISIVLVSTYFIYIYSTIHSSSKLVAEGNATKAENPLYLHRLFKLPENLFTVLLQVVIGVVALVYFAHFFVTQISSFAALVGISSFILSLLIIPIATELPEKFNSILWVLKKKDTLAMGNVSGALTFQGVLLPVFGIMMTPWVQNTDRIISVLCPILAAIWIKWKLKQNKLTFHNLMLLGLLYILAIYSMVVL